MDNIINDDNENTNENLNEKTNDKNTSNIFSKLNFDKDDIDFNIFEKDEVKKENIVDEVLGENDNIEKEYSSEESEINDYNLSIDQVKKILTEKAMEKYPMLDEYDSKKQSSIRTSRCKWRKKQLEKYLNNKNSKIKKGDSSVSDGIIIDVEKNNSEFDIDENGNMNLSKLENKEIEKSKKEVKKEIIEKTTEESLEHLFEKIRSYQKVLQYPESSDESLKKLSRKDLIKCAQTLDKRSSEKAKKVMGGGVKLLMYFGFEMIEKNSDFLNEYDISLKGLSSNARKHEKELIEATSEVLVETCPEIFPWLECKKTRFAMKIAEIFGDTIVENLDLKKSGMKM